LFKTKKPQKPGAKISLTINAQKPDSSLWNLPPPSVIHAKKSHGNKINKNKKLVKHFKIKNKTLVKNSKKARIHITIDTQAAKKQNSHKNLQNTESKENNSFMDEVSEAPGFFKLEVRSS